jgi:nicotinate-nucleotide adenylyltransferase
MVSNRPWQKVGSRTVTSPDRRMELVTAAVSDAPGVVASSLEIELGGPSYTAVTLDALAEREPGSEWLVIVGADAAAGLDSWHRADELRAGHRFVVVSRPGSDGDVPRGWACQHVEIPALDVSSSELRRMVGLGRSIRHLTPEPVVQLLSAWGLYGRGP